MKRLKRLSKKKIICGCLYNVAEDRIEITMTAKPKFIRTALIMCSDELGVINYAYLNTPLIFNILRCTGLLKPVLRHLYKTQNEKLYEP